MRDITTEYYINEIKKARTDDEIREIYNNAQIAAELNPNIIFRDIKHAAIKKLKEMGNPYFTK